MKLLLKTLLILSFLGIGCNNTKINWISFKWQNDTMQGKYYEKLAILIPVRIDDIPCDFIAQLDLGAFKTELYENSFKPFLKNNEAIINKLDTNILEYNGGKYNSYKNMDIYLDNVLFKNKIIYNHLHFGDTISKDSLLTKTPKHIGTIGVDLFLDKILLIDYPNKRIAVVDKIPNDLDFSFVDMKFENNFIKIPFTINNSKEYLIFDTGSSSTELMTTSANWFKYANLSERDSVMGNSWGRRVYLVWSKFKHTIAFNNRIIPNVNISYISGLSNDSFLEREKVFGLTGNCFFLNQMITIDFKHHRMGVKK